MRNPSNDQVTITTVVVRGPHTAAQAEWQHRRVTQAVLAGTQPVAGRRGEIPRAVYLGLSVLLLAGAVFFFYLALK